MTKLTGSGSYPIVSGIDPRIQIRIRIHTKMSWIRNTAFHVSRGTLSMCPGTLSMCPGTLSMCPGTLSMCPGTLFIYPGTLSMCPGTLFPCVQVRFPCVQVHFPCVQVRFPSFVFPQRSETFLPCFESRRSMEYRCFSLIHSHWVC
jgi:hypothetical protein